MTDVPFEVFLSRGLDSSLVVAMASQHLNDTKVIYVNGAQLHFFFINLKVMIDLD
jgi:asparagine synthetase B (glutamine-hydrolysing)